MNGRIRRNALVSMAVLAVSWMSCRDAGEEPGRQQATQSIATDADLFRFITQVQPFASYTLFPLADSVTTGTLNGSTAHRPLVRVSMNATAAAALQNGRFATPFPDGSVILKEIRNDSVNTTLFAVIYKDHTNPLAGNGWLWAEYDPGGGVMFSIATRGANCVSCHSRDQGPQHDFVRTFERQR